MRSCSHVNSDIVVPNFFINSYYEMDLFKLTKSGFVTEYEIKISRSDFFNDFKKGYNCNKSKHELIKEGSRICNYFVFVVPEGLVKKEEVPEHLGLMYYGDRFAYVQKGKKLHNRKFENYQMLAEKLSYRENNLSVKIRNRFNKESRVYDKYFKLLNYLSEKNIEVPYHLQEW